jgi:predicted nucleic acid-binding protein
MAVFPVVLDACVLFNAPVRDVLLRAAEYGAYRLHWTRTILNETTRNLNDDGRMNSHQAHHFITEISSAFPDAMIETSDDLISAMKNAPKDRHVTAAAVASSAQVIVTFNTNDFKPEHIGHLNIEAQNPDVFLLHLFSRQPALMIMILLEQAGDLEGVTFERLLNTLQRHVPDFIVEARKYISTR